MTTTTAGPRTGTEPARTEPAGTVLTPTALTRTGATFADELRHAADHPVPDLAGMLSSAAWHIDRLIAEVARLTGQPEGAVLTGHGLGAGPGRA